jgi:LysM repeat protein
MTRLRILALPLLLLLALVVLSHSAQQPATRPNTMPAEPSLSAVHEPTAVATRSSGIAYSERSALPTATEPVPGEKVKKALSIRTTRDTSVQAEVSFASHRVAAGDTLSDIVARYETSIATVLELNGLYDANRLLVGQELLIPIGFSDSGALEAALKQGAFERQVIGMSANGHPLETYRAGQGGYHVVIVGAIHGGYEWNTALLAYRILAHFSVYPDDLPADITLHILPIANPDGVVAVTGETGPFAIADLDGDTTLGRFNGNGVDLNRNWGCEWSAVGTWRQTTVSGGNRPISEPETRALREYLIGIEPDAVIWLHSAAGLLVPGNCNDINHEPSGRAARLYGAQAGYPVGDFSAYQVTGDAADWLAQHRIASFTVELTDHQGLEFERNLAGLRSLFEGIDTLDG